MDSSEDIGSNVFKEIASKRNTVGRHGMPINRNKEGHSVAMWVPQDSTKEHAQAIGPNTRKQTIF